MDATSWPIPPSLNISLLKPRDTLPNAVELHLGWSAAWRGEPLDYTQPAAWQAGYRMWHRVQALKPTPKPRVFPPI